MKKLIVVVVVLLSLLASACNKNVCPAYSAVDVENSDICG